MFFPSIKANVADLIPYARNSRTHSDEQVTQIASSIKEFGFTNPVLIDRDNGIIAGHGRVMAAKKLGMKDVPCIVADGWTDAQKKAYVIADNKLALNAGWDNATLALEFAELQELGFDLSLTGFSEAELAAINPIEVTGLTDEDAVPEAPEVPVTVLGDVWILGDHRVMCGDSTSLEAVQILMDGKTAEICFTSPPYADQREYNGGKELSTEHLATFIRTATKSVEFFVVNLGLSRKDGSINCYWNDYIKEAENVGLSLLSWNVWNRGRQGSIGLLTGMFIIAHEWVFVFGKKTKHINKTVENKSAGQKRGTADRQQDGTVKKKDDVEVSEFGKMGTVLDLPAHLSRSENINHPAMFPIEFPLQYIEAMTDRGKIVYEPFGGAGSTLIACEKTGRHCRLMELDPKYIQVILQRWADFTGNEPVLEATGQTFSEVKNVR